MTRVLLLRTPYVFGKPQIWLPMDLYKVAARLDAIGVQTDVADLNVDQLPDLKEYDQVGIGIVGAPSIPVSKDLAARIHAETGKPVLMGGQTVEKLPTADFQTIYNGFGTQMRNDADLLAALGKARSLPPASNTTVADRIRQMPNDKARLYLENEFSFVVSQGCKYNCDFCAAAKNMPETFSKRIKPDLDAICEKGKEVGIKKIEMYLSSLDLFQNPKQFADVLRIFAYARKEYGIDIQIRGLSRIDSFIRAMQKEPNFYKLIPEAGLVTVGFGVDGVTEEVWRGQHKVNKSLDEANRAFKICRRAGVTPEALLVLGFHPNSGFEGDTPESLAATVEYGAHIAKQFGTVLRPYVAKDFAPGNAGWTDPRYTAQKRHALAHLHLLKNLDYAAFASELTHPDATFRTHVNIAYDKLLQFRRDGLCVTSPIMPYRDGTGVFDEQHNKAAELFNKEVPFDH